MAKKQRKAARRENRESGPATRPPRNGPAQAPLPPGRYGLRGQATPYLLAILSALVLTLAFPPVEIAWLAYVALVPLMVMALRTPRPRTVFLAAWAGGTVFFAVNVWWIWPITAAGCIALIPYMGLYWALFAWGVRRFEDLIRLPLTLLAPVVWVPLEYLRGWMLTGMPWVYVGHSQYANTVLIQTADALGAYGPSFLVVMSAGLLADLILHPLIIRKTVSAPPPPAEFDADPAIRPTVEVRRVSRVLVAMMLLVATAWVGTVAYGYWRLGQAAPKPGPVVAGIQTVVPQDIKLAVKSEQMQTSEDIRKEIQRIIDLEHKMLGDQIDLTHQALAEADKEGLKVDLVVWPETMVPGIIGRAFLEHNPKVIEDYPDLQKLQARSRGYWTTIRDEARTVGAPILFGGHVADLKVQPDGLMTFTNQENTAFLIGPDTPPFAAEHTYAKAHLVPFGEYVPFKESWPWLHETLRGFTPYKYDYSLKPGAHDQKPFLLKFDGREARFQVAICYEDAMAYRVREMVRSDDPMRPKAVDFLVNISNDGWFAGSVELDQHLTLSAFRAVENRVPIVRSVNTGISALVDSSGRIEKVVEKNGSRRNVTGFITGRMAFDDRVAPYTRVGDLFAGGVIVALHGVIAACILRRLLRRKESSR